MIMKLTENFNLDEFHCKDGTTVPNSLLENVIELANNLQVLREKVDCPIHINSAYRTPEYNTKIGGSQNSQHVQAKAADITCRDYTPEEIATIIETLIAAGKMKQGGVGRYRGFTHYDIRGSRSRWTG